MAVVIGQAIGLMLCEVFGLPPDKVRAITLHNDIDDVAWLEVVRYVGEEEAGTLATQLARYDLVLRDEDEPEPLPAANGVADVTTVAQPERRYAAVPQPDTRMEDE